MKSYLLLRDNKQEGPFSLEQLQQKKLRSTDLIYVEGRSLSWRYPAEIEELSELVLTGEFDDQRQMVYDQQHRELRYVNKDGQPFSAEQDVLSFDHEAEQQYLRAHSVKVRIQEYQDEINYYATQNLSAEPVNLGSRLKQLFDQKKLVGMIRFW